MTGDFVVLRAFGGPVVRRVVEVVGDVVYIASDDQFSRMSSGLPAVEPVGFPSRDVFQYDPKFAKEIARGKVEWQRLTPYKAKAQGSGQA